MVGARPQIPPVVLQVKRDGLTICRTYTQAGAPMTCTLEKGHGVLIQLPAKTSPPARWDQVKEVHVSYGGILAKPAHLYLSDNGITVPDMHTTPRDITHPLREPRYVPFTPSPVRVHRRGRRRMLLVKAFVCPEAHAEGIRAELDTEVCMPC
jgi:hypothetical protein